MTPEDLAIFMHDTFYDWNVRHLFRSVGRRSLLDYPDEVQELYRHVAAEILKKLEGARPH